MERYDFDQVIERRGSGALKSDALTEFYGREDLLPMWVADMDFKTPDFITDARRQRLEHPIFGYTTEPKEYRPTIVKWIADRHNWQIESEWISFIPGIVKGIGMAINVFVAPDEKVIIQPPVYHPFRLTPLNNGREVVFNPLIENSDGSYSIDFENLEAVADSKCRMLILANPHNPVGIVWDRQTLSRLADFCYERNIIVISDEIHSDMALYGNRHIPFASVSEHAAECSITFGAPSKTFNIAGIVSSYAIVPNEQLRTRFYSWMAANELNAPHLFAPIATIAAFKYGEPWRQQMIEYIEQNIDFVVEYCAEQIPQIRPIKPQASFLVWLDCRNLNLEHEQLVELFVDKAHLALNEGSAYGDEGRGFMRLNIGTPRATLEKALKQLKDAVDSLN